MISGKDVVVWTEKGPINIRGVKEVSDTNCTHVLITGENTEVVCDPSSCTMSIMTPRKYGRKAVSEERMQRWKVSAGKANN